MKPALKCLISTISAFAIYYVLQKTCFNRIENFLYEIGINAIICTLLSFVIVGLPLFINLFIVQQPSYILGNLGISNQLLKGVLFAFVVCMPMIIGYSIYLDFNNKFSLYKIFKGVVFAAIFEELYFRAILFGQIFRFTRFGFFLSVVLSSLVFALGHLWQSNDLVEVISIFITTFMGGVLFAWLYIEWGYNIWVPISVHLFMNLYWNLFSGVNANGGLIENVFRAITIFMIIIGTIRYKRMNGLKFNIDKSNLWFISS